MDRGISVSSWRISTGSVDTVRSALRGCGAQKLHAVQEMLAELRSLTPLELVARRCCPGARTHTIDAWVCDQGDSLRSLLGRYGRQVET